MTRKGAVSAREGELGIIPGSMGARSFIVCGKGNPQSFHSCSHGAGRAMSRTEAKRRFTIEDHAAAVRGVECRLDEEVIDETPAAYKSIEAVMAAQTDLVDVVAELKQVLCVKGLVSMASVPPSPADIVSLTSSLLHVGPADKIRVVLFLKGRVIPSEITVSDSRANTYVLCGTRHSGLGLRHWLHFEAFGNSFGHLVVSATANTPMPRAKLTVWLVPSKN